MKLLLYIYVFFLFPCAPQEVPLVEIVPGLTALSNYEFGLSKAKNEKKPVFVYFRDRRSPNCRKFEKNILSNDQVKEYLLKKFVVICLLVDDPSKLPETKSSASGKVITTIGEFNIDLQISTFKSDSQPFSAVIDKTGTFVKGFSYSTDPKIFLDSLKEIK